MKLFIQWYSSQGDNLSWKPMCIVQQRLKYSNRAVICIIVSLFTEPLFLVLQCLVAQWSPPNTRIVVLWYKQERMSYEALNILSMNHSAQYKLFGVNTCLIGLFLEEAQVNRSLSMHMPIQLTMFLTYCNTMYACVCYVLSILHKYSNRAVSCFCQIIFCLCLLFAINIWFRCILCNYIS